LFGYVRPFTPELRVREYERFRACYCGLCRELGRGYGAFSRLILNFDFVFLAMLLWREDEEPKLERKFCGFTCRKRFCCKSNDALNAAAGYSVILAWHKLRDGIRDDGFVKATGARAASLALRGAYKRGAREHPEFDAAVRERLSQLAELEDARSDSLDACADSFARLLEGLAPHDGRERAMGQLLYHVGRWIYIADAADDLKEDCAAGRFNPLATRFGITDGALTREARESVETTLAHSLNLAGSALALLPENAWRGELENIIYLGMSETTRAVLDGRFNSLKRRRQRYPK
jgi:hypothetical protein